jgi:dTDP-4-amino-4,6-dideoxygalactose transaminase
MKSSLKINPIILDPLRFSTNDIMEFKNDEDYIKHICDIFKKKYNKKNIMFTTNARTAIYKCLNKMDLKRSDEVIIPAYTSKPVFDVVKKVCKPIFVDINSTNENINTDELVKKISKNTKAAILTNTYGKADDMDELIELADKYNFEIIEDLAQAPLGKYNNKNLGSFGKYTVLSFRLYKDLTCCTGGAFLTNENLKNSNNKVQLFSHKSYFWVFLARIFEQIPKIGTSMNYLRNVIDRKTRISNDKKNYTLSNLSAFLLKKQLDKLDNIILKRKKIAQYYNNNITNINDINCKNHTFYRFTIKVKNRDKIIKKGRRKGIYFGNIVIIILGDFFTL